MQQIKNIVLIGAGNVATQLGFALQNAGFHIVQVYSRTQLSAETLSKELSADFTLSINEISQQADWYIISLTDEATLEICNKLSLQGKLVVHTSGSLSMDILKNVSSHYGVFYPLQTFSKSREIEFSTIPICIEANSIGLLESLQYIGNKISNDVRLINSKQRKILHLAAVFACNFSNFMYSISSEILKNANLDFNMLKPLILETAEKVQHIDPKNAQTGPAIRGDQKIMEQHLELLKEKKELYDLYKFISDQLKTSNQ